MITSSRTATRIIATLLGLGLVGASLTACSVTTSATAESTSVVQSDSVATALWDSSVVHTVELVVDPDDLQGVIDTYLASGEKEWVSATVIIDGETFTDVGLKLKGNSSLRVVTAQSDPATLPWVIRLDKYRRRSVARRRDRTRRARQQHRDGDQRGAGA